MSDTHSDACMCETCCATDALAIAKLTKYVGSKFGANMLKDVLSSYDKHKAQNETPWRAAWCACYDWDI